jgi:DNA-directed RNA polymerase subunit RPC12/RpoP
MTTYKQAQEHFITLTRAYAKKMLPKGVPITIKFGKIIGESDGQIAPRYSIDNNGKPTNIRFAITYNEDFVDANKGNLKSYGVTGLIVHELDHARDFLLDMDGYLRNAHTNPVFKNGLAKYMGTQIGTMKYRSAMKPDPSTRCYKGCKYNVVPAWTSEYWIYFCPKCGFVDSYTTNMKAKSPVCESCGNKVLVCKKLPVNESAKMDVMVQLNPKSYNSDTELKNFIFKMLHKHLTPTQWSKVQLDLKKLKRVK